ncbi:MAG: class I adenylate cyclase [Cycloclasticus sp.]
MVEFARKSTRSGDLKKVEIIGPGGEISKKGIKLVKQRFLNLHKLKMQRAIEALTPRQKIFLEILPLLFHVNHPVLPGYISSKTPAGLADYTPSKLSINKAKKISKGFTYSKRAKRIFGIQALFIMGSAGSIAYAKGSDMDFWLCHAPGLSAEKLTLLQKKVHDIERWAATLGLEVHFFLIDAEQFKQGVPIPLSSESSGGTQHHLLLEEFYRTALYVAGRYPVWWLVPPEAENNYQAFVKKLLTQRFIDQQDVIDFGGLEHVPAEEFLGASFWHLYKAIDSPYKSLLKLMLMEAYVDQYPHCYWSASLMKQRVYDGESNANKFDGYLILYDVLEAYFINKNQPERLNLMRYCFYSKLNEIGRSRVKQDWRQEVLSSMLTDWYPLPDYLENSLEHKRWNISQVQQEKERLMHELTHSYRLLMTFANERIDKSKRDTEELMLLGRKLDAAFANRPSKLERSTIKNKRIQHESKVVLKQQVMKNKQPVWVLNRLDNNQEQHFIRQERSLIALLAWGVDYAVLDRKTKIALDPGESHIGLREVTQTLRSVFAFFDSLPKMPAYLDEYRYEPSVSNVMLVINSGVDSMSDFTEKGVNLTSDRSDALSFGSQRRNLIHTVDMMLRNSWNEMIVVKYESANGLIAVLCDIFDTKALGAQQVLPTLMCASYYSARATSVAKRIEALFREIAIVFKQYSNQVSPRFIFQIARSFCLMQVKNGKMTAIESSKKRLLSTLSAPQPVYSPLVFDKRINEKDLLPVLYGNHKEGCTQLYYIQQAGDQVDVYILDEKGSMYFNKQGFINEPLLLQPYKTFIESTVRRRGLLACELDKVALELTFECYRVEKVGQHWSFKKVFVGGGLEKTGMEIRVAYDGHADEFSIHCNDHVFTSIDDRETLYSDVSTMIRQERASVEHSPVYIADIDVPLSELGASRYAQLQTVHYLKYKQRMEEKMGI